MANEVRDTRQSKAAIDGGFLVVPRNVFELPQRLRYVYLELFDLAVYAPYLHRGTGMTLQPGQCLYTRSFIANRCGLTLKQTRSAINALANGHGLIETIPQGNGILITVLNYRETQDLKEYTCNNNSTISNEGRPEGRMRADQTAEDKGTCADIGPDEGRPEGHNKNSNLKEHQKNTPLPPKGDCEKFVTLWNEICGEKLPKVRELTDNRKRQIRSRLKKKPFPWWKTVFEKIVRLPFYCGGGEHGWKCTIDYIIRNDTNAVKILEYEETQISVKPEADRICPECGGDPEWREEAVPGQLWKCGKCGGKGKI